MTNDTAPHENGVADPAAIAALTSTAADPASETAAPADSAPKPPSFDDLGLHPDIKLALDDMGYFEPTPVQAAVFKPVSEGKDLMVQARTGTGKTTAFGLPTLSKVVPTQRTPQALILAPTRELALQVARELTQLGKHRGIIVETLYGGAPIGKQIENLRNGVHIVVGTPGRVLDHLKRRTLDPKTITTFILDECDEMLSMGFLEDIERVVAQLPEKKQTLLFSATMPDEVSRYSRRHMVNPENMSLSRDSSTVSDIHHAYYIVSGIARSRDLLKIIYAEEPESAIIFCNMRDETTMVARFLQKQGLDAEPLSSDLSQNDRERVMGRMKAKNLRFLCATDVAARGIDIASLSHVINYSVPESPEVYVHRTGRTGRAGKKGTALSMVGPRELGNFRYVRLQFGLKPEERLLPKDDIFTGKLKTPLPPVGIPQPPDPVQILIRGVTGTPSDLEMKIFEKLYTTQSGKRVLAALVAERLDKLSTKVKPRAVRTERPAHAEGDGAPHEARPEGDRGDRPDRGERRPFDRDGGERRPFGDGDRPRRFDGERGDRPRRFDRDDRGPRPEGDRDRPRFDADRGPRPEGDRGPRPEGDRGPRPEGEGDRPRRFDGERGDRPRRFDRDDRGPRAEGDRERRPWRDRDDRNGAPREDRGPRPDRNEVRAEGGLPAVVTAAAPAASAAEDAASEAMTTRIPVIPVVDATTEGQAQPERSARPEGERGRRDYRDRMRSDRPEGDRPQHRAERVEGAPSNERTDRPEGEQRTARPEGEQRADRGDRGGRDRDRGGRDRDRGGRDRDRGGRERDDRPARTDAPRSEAPVAVAATEAAPAVEVEPTTLVTKVDDVARAAVERADRADRPAKGGKRGGKSEPTAETREFWETWAEEKSTRPAATEVVPAAASASASEPAADGGEREERGGRGRGGRDRGGRGGRGRGGDKDRGERGTAKAETTDTADKAEKPAGRSKRDTEVAPPPAAATAGDATQARLFVSLGKKHGVSADDLRSLLAAPIGGDKARIGSVSLRDSHAHVRVPEELVETIIGGVHGTQHNEHDVTVERARA